MKILDLGRGRVLPFFMPLFLLAITRNACYNKDGDEHAMRA